MRFLHLSDLHLGKRLRDLSLLEEQKAFLDWTLELIKAHEVDFVVVAGDIYDRSVPSADAIRLLDDYLSELNALNIPAYLIPGNHDAGDRLAFGSRLFQSEHIYIASGDPPLERFTLDGDVPVAIDLLPFLRAVDLRRFEPEATRLSTEAALRYALDSLPAPDPKYKRILVTHQFVTGEGMEPELGDSERAYVGPADQVSADLFGDYDYVAMGHIHRPQAMGTKTVRYGGAPMAFKFSERDTMRTVPLVTLTQDSVDVDLIPIPAERRLVSWQGLYRELRELLLTEGPEAETLRENYCQIILDDPEPPERVFASLRRDLPYLVHLGFAATPTSLDTELMESPESQSLGELFASFYQTMTESPMSDIETTIVDEAIRAVEEVDHEAD